MKRTLLNFVILPLVAIGMVYFLYIQVTGMAEEIGELKVQTAMFNQELKDLRDQIHLANERNDTLNDEVAAARREAQEAKRILKDHNLEKLLKAKPNLIIKRMNAGTDRALQALEDASNE